METVLPALYVMFLTVFVNNAPLPTIVLSDNYVQLPTNVCELSSGAFLPRAIVLS